MTTHKLIGLSGSLRAASYNSKLLADAARHYGNADYAEGDLRLPLYDGDLEAADGIPPEVRKLAEQITAADAVLIATPEYNKGISGVLKNALDWISRAGTGAGNSPLKEKPVAILSASSGRAGGERAQMMLRWCLMPFQTRLLQGPEVLVAQTHTQFDDDHRLTGDINLKTLQGLMTALKAEVER